MPIVKVILLFQAAVFGMIVGSFLNVWAYRLPMNLSLWGRSFCPQCTKPIPMYRNIPVLTYLFQLGKTACCGKKIPWHYAFIEAFTGFMAVLTLWRWNDFGSPQLDGFFIWFLLFVCPLIVISIIDFKLMIIPDAISLPFMIFGVLAQVYFQFPDFLGALAFSGLGILAGGGTLLVLGEIISRLKGIEAMGGGDIKIAAMMGAFLGWRAMIPLFFFSSLFALVYIVGLKLLKKDSEDPHFPFGPFLAMGGVGTFLFGKIVTDWYFFGSGFAINPIFPN